MSFVRVPFARAGVLALLVLLAGCSVSPLARHTAAFSSVTNLAVDNSENAYRAAVRLHDQEQMVAAVAKYDTDPTWDPHKIQIKRLIDDQGSPLGAGYSMDSNSTPSLCPISPTTLVPKGSMPHPHRQVRV